MQRFWKMNTINFYPFWELYDTRTRLAAWNKYYCQCFWASYLIGTVIDAVLMQECVEGHWIPVSRDWHYKVTAIFKASYKIRWLPDKALPWISSSTKYKINENIPPPCKLEINTVCCFGGDYYVIMKCVCQFPHFFTLIYNRKYRFQNQNQATTLLS